MIFLPISSGINKFKKLAKYLWGIKIFPNFENNNLMYADTILLLRS